MNNKEIDIRLKAMAEELHNHYERKIKYHPKLEVELELLNMQIMVVFAMLGEIAKRLPEAKE